MVLKVYYYHIRDDNLFLIWSIPILFVILQSKKMMLINVDMCKSFINKRISVFPVWTLLSLCMLNLLVMHYYVYLTCNFECKTIFVTFVDNFFGVFFDVIVIFIFTYFIFLRSQKFAICFTWIVTFLWSFSNILYSRFFHHYLTLSAICQVDELVNNQLLSCVIDGLRWEDCFFIFDIILFSMLMRICRSTCNIIKKLLFFLSLGFCIDMGAYAVYCCLTPERRHVSYIIQSIENRQFSSFTHLCNPNDTCFRRGCIRSLLYEVILSFHGVQELSEIQLQQIQSEIKLSSNTISNNLCISNNRNVIFILVESYMSFVSDKTYANKEVTPFLNSLKRSPNVYYNGLMRENVTIGESSDGQFIYMTGLLPLRSVITVSKARNIKLPGLPVTIKKNSLMVIPTIASLWNQNEMCQRYGVNQLYTSDDYSNGLFPQLNDEQVFDLAIQKDSKLKEPFFLMVLTMSMHQPYTKQVDSSFLIDDPSMSRDLACYLNMCHYTDSQIKRYFEHLKRNGLFDKSVIVIAADHSVHNTDFGGVSKHIPFYIVNLPQDIIVNLWKGECNQIDVYPTLLDILGIDSDWYGLGCSLLTPNYTNSLSSSKWDASEWIIRGNYFSR